MKYGVIIVLICMLCSSLCSFTNKNNPISNGYEWKTNIILNETNEYCIKLNNNTNHIKGYVSSESHTFYVKVLTLLKNDTILSYDIRQKADESIHMTKFIYESYYRDIHYLCFYYKEPIEYVNIRYELYQLQKINPTVNQTITIHQYPF